MIKEESQEGIPTSTHFSDTEKLLPNEADQNNQDDSEQVDEINNNESNSKMKKEQVEESDANDNLREEATEKSEDDENYIQDQFTSSDKEKRHEEKEEASLKKRSEKKESDQQDFWREMKEYQQNEDEEGQSDQKDKPKEKVIHKFSNQNYQPYPLYLTPITEEIDHEKMIYILKDQNAKLNQQLKFLNLRLTEILSKQQKKANSKMVTEQSTKDPGVIQKELDNAYKKIDYLTKQNKSLNQKMEKLSTSNLNNLETQLKEKEQIIFNLQEEVKCQDNILKRQAVKTNASDYKNPDSMQQKIEESEKQINILNGEVRRLKNAGETQSKQLIKKQEQIVDLEQRYREICEAAGISVHSKQPIKEELQKLNSLRQSADSKLNLQLQNASSQQQKQEQLQSQLEAKSLMIQVRELTSQMKLKDKEISSLKIQLKIISDSQKQTPDLANIKKQVSPSLPSVFSSLGVGGVLGPVRKVISLQEKKLEQIGSLLLGSQRGQSAKVERIINKDPNNQNSEREQYQQEINRFQNKLKKEIEGKQGGCSKRMSDRDLLQHRLHTKIIKVVLWTNNRAINGIQFFYLDKDNTEIEGHKMVVDKSGEYTRIECNFNDTVTNNLVDQNQNIKSSPQQFKQLERFLNNSNVDYLKELECSISPQGCIQKLILISAQGKVFEGGSATKNKQLIKKYNFSKFEYPVCAFGGLITFIDEQRSESGSVLSYLGFEVMIDYSISQQRSLSAKCLPQGYKTFCFDKDKDKENKSQNEMQSDKVISEI